MQKTITLITGAPGTGKTTLIMHVTETLKARGNKIGGMTSREHREGTNRNGFLIQNVSTGEQGWLARINQPSGPRVGKYRINLADLENIGVAAIREATKSAGVVIIDEIGPMELHSQAFRQAVEEALDSGKPVLATIHFKATDAFVTGIKTRPDVELIEITLQNRDVLHNLLIGKILKTLHGD